MNNKLTLRKMFQLGGLERLSVPSCLFISARVNVDGSVFVFTGNSNDPWQRGHAGVCTKPGLLVLQMGECPEFISLEVRIQCHSSSMFPGMLRGILYIAKGKVLPSWFTSNELEVRARSSQLLPVAIEDSRPVDGDLFPGTYAMFLLILNWKKVPWFKAYPQLPFLGVVKEYLLIFQKSIYRGWIYERYTFFSDIQGFPRI